MSIRDRQRGALLGLAVGDALGAAVEFSPPGSFEKVEHYRGGGPHGLAPGEWTDDTSMALALGDSIGSLGWDLNDQARRYLSWWHSGEYSVTGSCFDIGHTTARALQRFEETGDASSSGLEAERSSGNGSIMRLAPVPIAYLHLFPHSVEALAELGADSSKPTHRSSQCLSAARYLTVALAGLMHGSEREEVLSPQWGPLQRIRGHAPVRSEVDEVASGSFAEHEPPEIRGSGYVVKTLEAALWAFHRASTFREAVLAVVNLGDDADTTGAVCGQLAGAHWGESSIPPDLLEGLAGRDMIERVLDELVPE